MAWNAVDGILTDLLPAEAPSELRLLLEEAIACLVVEAENCSVIEHGEQILLAISGERFQQIRSELQPHEGDR